MTPRELLAALVQRDGGEYAVAQAMGNAAFQSTLWRAINKKTGAITQGTAQKIAAHYRIPLVALYDDQEALAAAVQLGLIPSPDGFAPIDTGQKHSEDNTPLAPVIAWASVGELMMLDNKNVQGMGLQPAPPGAAANFKWVVASEDAPAFGVFAGHQMAIDPVDPRFQPVERKIYLFRTDAGYHFLGRYRGLSGANYEAVTSAGDTYTKGQHGLVLLARFRGAIEA